MRLLNVFLAASLMVCSAAMAETTPPEGVTPTQCGPGPAGAPCDGSGPASQGNVSGTNQGAGNPINVITGNKYQQEVDLPALPGVLGLEIVRHYNSSLSTPKAPNGILGRGWRLSYETDLYAIGNTLQIVQADGTRIIFVRDRNHPSQCATNDPARGKLSISRTAHGDTYTWTWANGRKLNFNPQGKLTQIKAPTGEFVSLTRDLAGALVKVTDPQGRSLSLGYPQRKSPDRFNGVTHIDSPVGRFAYAYGSPPPKGSPAPVRAILANLAQVTLPDGVGRHYHYEDAVHPTLLTGISVEGKGSNGKFLKQRISTWAYDEQGRGILSYKGDQPKPGQPGIEQVRLNFDAAGKTVLTNSLGQITTYRHAILGGEYRLLEVRGAGCASCGEANVKYGYDKLGRLTEETKLNEQGQPIAVTRTQRDTLGRVVRVSRLSYVNGKPQAVQFVARYEYTRENTQPSLIARPSVIRGKEVLTRIDYNAAGQPLSVSEAGFSPGIDGKEPNPIAHSTTYTYRDINGRSLLTAIDGPLKNGPRNSPADSDVTMIKYDGRGSYVTKLIAPGNLTAKIEYDEAGRAGRVSGPNGVATETTYDTMSRAVATRRYPAGIGPQAAKEAGLLLATATLYDALGRATQITRPDGQILKLSFGSNGQLSQLSDGLGNRVEWKDWTQPGVTAQQWFSADAPTQVARAWYFWRDGQDRLTQRLNPDGGLDQWTYPQADKGWRTHTDPLGRMIASAQNTDAAAQVRMTPDGYLDASLQTQDENASPVQTQDDFGRIVRFASAQHGVHIAQYNAAGQIIRITQADGTQIDYTYDVAGRLTQKRADRPGQTGETIRYRYTAHGLATVEDGSETTAYGHDALGRQISKTIALNRHSYVIRTRYDERGRVKAKQLADGNWLVFTLNARTGLTETIKLHHPILHGISETLARWFNAPDLPLMLATRKTVVTDIQTSPLDGITRTVNGNGSVTDYRFDQAGRLAAIEHAPTPGNTTDAIFKASYQYDAGRRLVSEKQNASDTAYRYADWDRLTLPTQANAQTQPQPAIQPRHDQAGRTVQDAQYRYHYDVWGKLQSVTDAKADNKVVATYAHNAYGERVKASHGGQTRYYLYDNQKRVAELDQNGRILQQYLYLNDKPIAVLDSSTGGTELVALHTDRRGAPVAASNERGKVIWTASYSAWGRAKVQTVSTAANDATFNLDLRLPGQWEDRATHLHYNYQRDYDPGTGRYLTPDPLGFPDGPDAYLYVGGDPVNRVDPLGLYSTEVHYYMTYFLARMAGVDAQTAYTIALGTQFIDDNPVTWPLDENSVALGYISDPAGAIERLSTYHFTTTSQTADFVLNPFVSSLFPFTYDPSRNSFESFYRVTHLGYDYIGYIQRRIENPTNPQLTLLTSAYGKAPNRCAKAQLFGEFLHALEDTFGHRNQDNEPIHVNAGLGHGGYGHEPDKTYNHTITIEDVLISSPGFEKLSLGAIGDWDQNEARTLEMEKEVFNKMHSTWGTTGKNQMTGNEITFNSIQNFLKNWNKIQDEGQKITELNFKLAEMGFETIPTYDKKCAGAKRDEYIGGLKQSDYPGVLLPDKNGLGKSGTVKQACGG